MDLEINIVILSAFGKRQADKEVLKFRSVDV